MGLILLFLQYLALAGIVVYASVIVGKLVDEFDKRTNLSGAFIGGLVLAAVTSLPEFITSITSILVYNEPGLAFGNIFGSNIFNLVILAVIDLIFVRYFVYSKIKGIEKSNQLSIIIYLVILIPFVINFLSNNGLLSIDVTSNILYFIQKGEFLGISLLSVIILVLYVMSAKVLSQIESDKVENNDSKEGIFSKYHGAKLIILFVTWSGVLVGAAYFITGVTNKIALATNMNASVAGALFLGIATSLPEMTTCYTLIKLKNYNAAAGGIIGSNIFNFTIIAIVDVFVKSNIIDLIVSDPSVSENALTLLILGLINSIILMLALKRTNVKSKFFYIFPSVLIILNYIFYLLISFI